MTTSNIKQQPILKKPARMTKVKNARKAAFPVGGIPKSVGGLPGFLDTTMQYVQQVSLDPGASLSNNTFNANSLYDPDQSGTGHQPSGFDTLAAMYSRYLVKKATIDCYFFLQGATTSVPLAIGINLYDGSSPYGSGAIAMLEQSNGVHLITCKNGSNGVEIPRLRCTFDAKKWFGLTNLDDNRETIGALTNSNPTRRAYFQVWTGPTDESTDLDAVICVARITYHVQFHGPLQVGTS